MKSRISIAAILCTLLLHGIAIALVLIAVPSHTEKPAEPLSFIAQFVAIPPAPQPVVAVSPPAKKEQPAPQPIIAPNPRPPAPAVQVLAPVPSPSTDAPPEAMPIIVNNAPPAPSAPVTPPALVAHPAKTGVSISAAYADSNRKPLYPSLSKRYGEQGIVTLRVLVQADGTPGTIEIRASSGYPLLDDAAKAAVQTWRFVPATVDGTAVAEWYQIPIPFKLQN